VGVDRHLAGVVRYPAGFTRLQALLRQNLDKISKAKPNGQSQELWQRRQI